MYHTQQEKNKRQHLVNRFKQRIAIFALLFVVSIGYVIVSVFILKTNVVSFLPVAETPEPEIIIKEVLVEPAELTDDEKALLAAIEGMNGIESLALTASAEYEEGQYEFFVETETDIVYITDGNSLYQYNELDDLLMYSGQLNLPEYYEIYIKNHNNAIAQEYEFLKTEIRDYLLNVSYPEVGVPTRSITVGFDDSGASLMAFSRYHNLVLAYELSKKKDGQWIVVGNWSKVWDENFITLGYSNADDPVLKETYPDVNFAYEEYFLANTEGDLVAQPAGLH
jgi:hypothetical protein